MKQIQKKKNKKLYWFTFLLLCVGKIVNKKQLQHGWRKKMSGDHKTSLLISMLKLMDIENIFRNIQGIKQEYFALLLLCFRKIANKKWLQHGWGKKNISYWKNANHNL